MKATERRVHAIEFKLHEKFNHAWKCELEKEVHTQRPMVRAALEDMKLYNEIAHIIHPEWLTDIKSVITFHREIIKIIDHHLPACAARIREKISWL